MKTTKEMANELGLNYQDLVRLLRVIRWPKLVGTYRFTEHDQARLKEIMATTLKAGDSNE